eukprot:5324706-Pleurochrysis_carterae.AAC.3
MEEKRRKRHFAFFAKRSRLAFLMTAMCPPTHSSELNLARACDPSARPSRLLSPQARGRAHTPLRRTQDDGRVFPLRGASAASCHTRVHTSDGRLALLALLAECLELNLRRSMREVLPVSALISRAKLFDCTALSTLPTSSPALSTCCWQVSSFASLSVIVLLLTGGTAASLLKKKRDSLESEGAKSAV